MSNVNVFISSVSSEFGSYRNELCRILTRPNVAIKIQEDFIAAGTVTLDKLDDYIQSCEAVVHLVGDWTGATANASSLAWIRERYPQLPVRFPTLTAVLDDSVASSYTQWEAYLALYHNKVLLVATPTAEAARDAVLEPAAADAQRPQQAAHLARLRAMGSYPEITFGTVDRLAAEVAVSRLYDLSVAAGVRAAGIAAALQPPKPANLPYNTLGSLFKGRETFIRMLREEFTAAAGSPRKALHGLGGIGKTRLAVEYALRHQEHYTALLFVPADSPQSLQANLANLCGPLVLNLPEQEAQDQDVKLGAALRWLEQHPGWFLILDGLDTDEAAQAAAALLPQLRGGHVVLTTRVEDWSREVECLALEVLREEDARDFLLERTESRRRLLPDDATTALALARDLGQLALALEQAGAYIEAKRITLPTYHERWTTNYKAVREWFDEHLMHYPRSVAATWQTSFDQLGAEAVTLLNRLAWLAAEPIPLTLLEVPVPETEPLDTEDALNELAHYSLATYAADNAAVSVHRLVQEVTRTRFATETRPHTFAEALMWVKQAFKGNPQDVHTWSTLNPLQPHALQLAQYASTFEDSNVEADLLGQLGILLHAKAQFLEAEPLLRRALHIREASYGPEHPDVATSLNNLALLLKDTNRLTEAEPLYQRALRIREASYGPEHPLVATTLNNLASLLQATNRPAEAEPLFRRALHIREASYGPEHPLVATSLNNLALLLQDTNRLAEAEPLFQRAISILIVSQQRPGYEHPNFQVTASNYVGLLRQLNYTEEVIIQKLEELGLHFRN